MGKAREAARAQPQLHGMALGYRVRLDKQQPRHHALDVFQIEPQWVFQKHAALNPLRAQVQVAACAVFRDIDFGQVG